MSKTKKEATKDPSVVLGEVLEMLVDLTEDDRKRVIGAVCVFYSTPNPRQPR